LKGGAGEKPNRHKTLLRTRFDVSRDSGVRRGGGEREVWGLEKKQGRGRMDRGKEGHITDYAVFKRNWGGGKR